MDKVKLRNLKLILAVSDDDDDVEQKKINIRKCVDSNADVNAQDANNNNNTPLHFAVLKEEVEIVRLLREKYKARIDIKNYDGQTPRDLAAQLTSHNGTQIIDILGPAQKSGKQSAKCESSVHKQQQIISMKSDVLQFVFESEKNPFPKDKGTLGVSGHLYETKLLSLVYLRARKENKSPAQCNEQMEYFHLGTNRPQIGAFDDLYLKYKYKDRANADVMFIQAKHKLDATQGTITRESLHAIQGNYNLTKYFKAYMKIKHFFGKKESSDDIVFNTNWDAVNCKFVIYTVGSCNLKSSEILLLEQEPTEQTDIISPKRIALTEKDYNLIVTSARKNIFQLIPNDSDIEILTRASLDDELRKLGKHMAENILDGVVDMTTNEIIRKHHILLADKVIVVSKPVKLGEDIHRTGKLHESLFSSDDEHISTLRGAMFKEVVAKSKKRSIKDKDVQNQIHKLLNSPSSETISKLLGNVIFFDDAHNTLKFIEKTIPKELLHLATELKTVRVTKGDIKEAYELIGKRKVASKEFKLPLQFGNRDISTDDANADQKIRLLGLAFIQLLNNFKHTRVIEINSNTFPKKSSKKSVDIRDVAGTVGNLLIFDEAGKLLKFNTNHKSLPKYAKMLLRNIQDGITNSDELSSYRLRIDVEGFPRATWNTTDIDKVDANDFFSKLWFFAAQDQEESVEIKVKEEIDKLNEASRQAEKKKHTSLKIQSEAIYLKFHDVIQKWAMLPKTSYYISDKTDVYDRVRECVMISPLLSILNFIYAVSLENAKIRFDQDVISKLEIETSTANTLIIESESNMLTAIKIKQYYEQEDYSFIDLDNTMTLFHNDIDMVLRDLKHSQMKVLIIVCEKITNCRLLCDLLKEYERRSIVITNAEVAQELKQSVCGDVKVDGNISLDDIVETSQERILQTNIVFQGYEVKLYNLLSDESKRLLKNGVLCKIIKNEAIEIGNAKLYVKQDTMLKFPYYMSRSLRRRGRRDTSVNTFGDISENVVTIVATAGMGKSTLLSSLFTQTKTIEPSFCAIRVCLPDHYPDPLGNCNLANSDIAYVLTLLFKIGLVKGKEVNDKEPDKMDFTLIESNGKIALHSFKSGTDCQLLGLEIFIDYFNNGNLTLVFDGFDEIFPKYEGEVILLLNILKSYPIQQRIWITSRPYNDAQRVLEDTFGPSYTLAPLSAEEQKQYLLEYWKIHMDVGKFDTNHITNIIEFLDYKAQFSKVTERNIIPEIELRCIPLHIIYQVAETYFAEEVENIKECIDKEKLKKKLHLDQSFALIRSLNLTMNDLDLYLRLSGNPLHLHIMAYYMETQIKCVNSKPKWDLIMNTYALYDHFIRSKIIKISHEEKDDHKIRKATEELRCDEEIKTFKEKHNKIALFTFYTDDIIQTVFRATEMEEAKSIIKDIERCKEKRGFVDGVVHGVPKFVHLIFAEYFAVEYVCDKLKTVLSTGIVNEEFRTVLGFVMNIFLFEGYPGLRSLFDYKLEIDPVLQQQMKKEYCMEHIFIFLLEQFEYTFNKKKESNEPFSGLIDTVLSVAISETLDNVLMYLIACVQCCLDNNTLEIFAALLRYSPFINTFVYTKRYEPINIIFDSIRRVDNKTFEEKMCNGYLLKINIDKSIVHSNSLIIQCLYAYLHNEITRLNNPVTRRRDMDASSEASDVILISRHISPTRGAVRNIGHSLLENTAKEYN